jgi:hypothetical protein
MSVTKTQKTLEERRLYFFGQSLLDAWTNATNSASYEAFHQNDGYLPSDANHFAAFAGICADEAKFLELSLRERFPKNDLLVKACLASVAACICRTLVNDAASA